jgi:hypothetical protein
VKRRSIPVILISAPIWVHVGMRCVPCGWRIATFVPPPRKRMIVRTHLKESERVEAAEVLLWNTRLRASHYPGNQEE